MDVGQVKPAPAKNRWSLAAFGAFGGALPTVVKLFELVTQNDATRPSLGGYLHSDVAIVTAIYLASAAVLATIFPYPRRPSAWFATSVGAAMPTLVGSMSAAATHLGPAVFGFRGGDEPAYNTLHSLLALLALF
jgi:hypothetical protein